MKKVLQDKCFGILFFLSLYGLSIGVFDNYRELWMSVNGLSTTAISHVISISYLVTVLVLFFFTIKVSTKKLKSGILISLLLKMIIEAFLIWLNRNPNIFLIKFFMFFDIAFSQIILSCVYPLMMNIDKNDMLYTKKSFVESLFNKLGFLFVSIILGHTIFNKVIDYNYCLLLSVIFTFLAFLVLASIKLDAIKEKKLFDINKAINYFSKNKILYLFLITNMGSYIVWSSILGMPMLTLTNNLSFSSKIASFLILGLGIIANFLAMLTIKCFRFKNDQINLFIKFGTRIILYLLIIFLNNKYIYFLTLIYMLLTERTYDFIFNSYFINTIKEEYSLLLTALNYCSALVGTAIGTFFCGLVFNLEIKYLVLPALLIAVMHYILAIILVEKKKEFKISNV
jgi:hypothetical protein